MNAKLEWTYASGEVEAIQKAPTAHSKEYDVASVDRQFLLFSGRPVVALCDQALRVRRGKGWSVAFEGKEWSRSDPTIVLAPDDSLLAYSNGPAGLSDQNPALVYRVEGARHEIVSDEAPQRSRAGLAWTPDGIVLFGGVGPAKSGCTPPLSDTFMFTAGKWKKLAGKGPAARTNPVIVGTRSGALLWGGFDTKRKMFTDCWRFESGAWHAQPGTRDERLRTKAAIALDDDRILSFDVLPDASVHANLWEGASWREVGQFDPIPDVPWYQISSVAVDLDRASLLLHVPAADENSERDTHPESHILVADLTALLADVRAIPLAAPAKTARAKAPAAPRKRART